MLSRRLHHIPLLCLLIISLLMNPAVTSDHVSTDGHSFLEGAIAGNRVSDNHDEETANTASSALSSEKAECCGPCLGISTSHYWRNSRTRQGDLPVRLLVGTALTTVAAPVPLPERNLNPHRLVAASPRIPDPILHHRTIVLLI
jgi:hypothetical protein